MLYITWETIICLEVNVIFLYHYFDKTIGPFVSLSDIPIDEAKTILKRIKEAKPNTQCAKPPLEYIERRRNCEQILKTEFMKKGGIIKRNSPYYMVIEYSPWLSTWFESCAFLTLQDGNFTLKMAAKMRY